MTIQKRNYVPGQYETLPLTEVGAVTANNYQYFELDGFFKFEVADVVVEIGGNVVSTGDYELKQDDKYTALEATKTGKSLKSMIRFINASLDGLVFSVSGLNFGTMIDNEGVKGYVDSKFDLVTNPEYIDFIEQDPDLVHVLGRLFYSKSRRTLRLYNDITGFSLDLGRSTSSPFIADEDILKGQPLYVSSQTPGDLHVAIASNKRYNQNWIVGIAGNDGLAGETVEFVSRGGLEGLGTSAWATQVPLYLGDGEIVDERPKFPYADSIFIGAVVHSDATNGVLGVAVNIDPYDVTLDGNIIEQQTTNIVVIGGITYMDVANIDPTRNLPFQLDSMENELETTTPGVLGKSRVQLIDGTATAAQFQTVYIELTAGVPTLKVTAGTPPEMSSIVGFVSLLDSATTDTDKAQLHRDITTAKSHDGTGSLHHVLLRLAEIPPSWKSGVTPTATTDGTDMQLSVIAGKVWQTHLQDFPALSIDTSGIYVANGPGGAGLANNLKVNSLSDLLGWTSQDEARDTSCTGQLVPFALINKDAQTCKLMVNLPIRLSTSTASGGRDAYYNDNNDAVFSGPSSLKYTAFALARIPYRLSGGSYQFVDTNGDPTNDGSFIINRLGKSMDSGGGAAGNGTAPTPPLIDVLIEGNDAGNIQIKNAANATDTQDLTTLSQVETAIGNLDIEQVLINGSDANGQDIDGVSRIQADSTTGMSYLKGVANNPLDILNITRTDLSQEVSLAYDANGNFDMTTPVNKGLNIINGGISVDGLASSQATIPEIEAATGDVLTTKDYVLGREGGLSRIPFDNVLDRDALVTPHLYNFSDTNVPFDTFLYTINTIRTESFGGIGYQTAVLRDQPEDTTKNDFWVRRFGVGGVAGAWYKLANEDYVDTEISSISSVGNGDYLNEPDGSGGWQTANRSAIENGFDIDGASSGHSISFEASLAPSMEFDDTVSSTTLTWDGTTGVLSSTKDIAIETTIASQLADDANITTVGAVKEMLGVDAICTPTLSFSGDSTGITYNTQTCTSSMDVNGWFDFYIKIKLTSKGTATGNAIIALSQGSMSMLHASVNLSIAFADDSPMLCYLSGGDITFLTYNSGGFLTNTHFTDTSWIEISGRAKV